jgi:hypothetical protein
MGVYEKGKGSAAAARDVGLDLGDGSVGWGQLGKPRAEGTGRWGERKRLMPGLKVPRARKPRLLERVSPAEERLGSDLLTVALMSAQTRSR